MQRTSPVGLDVEMMSWAKVPSCKRKHCPAWAMQFEFTSRTRSNRPKMSMPSRGICSRALSSDSNLLITTRGNVGPWEPSRRPEITLAQTPWSPSTPLSWPAVVLNRRTFLSPLSSPSAQSFLRCPVIKGRTWGQEPGRVHPKGSTQPGRAGCSQRKKRVRARAPGSPPGAFSRCQHPTQHLLC